MYLSYIICVDTSVWELNFGSSHMSEFLLCNVGICSQLASRIYTCCYFNEATSYAFLHTVLARILLLINPNGIMKRTTLCQNILHYVVILLNMLLENSSNLHVKVPGTEISSV